MILFLNPTRRARGRVVTACLAAVAALPITAKAAGFPMPRGLRPCPAGDRVASLESKLAKQIRGHLLGCFRTAATVALSPSPGSGFVPLEYGFAMRLPGGRYTPAAVHQLFLHTEAQWAGFKPLNGKLSRQYTDRLNAVIRGSASNGTQVSIKTIKPVLISIHRLGPSAYSVVSLRTYQFSAGNHSVRSVKIDADAVVLDHGRLVRLTLLREARSATDVRKAQSEMASWVHAVRLR